MAIKIEVQHVGGEITVGVSPKPSVQTAIEEIQSSLRRAEWVVLEESAEKASIVPTREIIKITVTDESARPRKIRVN